jgi:hypothetical protein
VFQGALITPRAANTQARPDFWAGPIRARIPRIRQKAASRDDTFAGELFGRERDARMLQHRFSYTISWPTLYEPGVRRDARVAVGWPGVTEKGGSPARLRRGLAG